jgi:hypothetical protein
MHDIKSNFDKVYQTIESPNLSVFDSSDNLLKPGPRSEFTDLEVIALSLVAEFMSCDSENWLFNKLRSDYQQSFPNLIDRSRFNRRKRGLFLTIDLVRSKLAELFLSFEDYYIIDSMPLEVCQLSMEKRSKVCAEAFETSPEKDTVPLRKCTSMATNYKGFVR